MDRNGPLMARLRNRKWPLVAALLMLGLGMAFMLAWNTLIDHGSGWYVPADVWGIYRAAHYVGWGYLGGIYTPGNGVVSFPGMAVLLAPVAMLGGSLHLTESLTPLFVARPTAALLVEPIELLVASTVVFASDALAQRLRCSQGRRVSLSILIAILAWPTAALWGHAEDALAMTFAILALVAVLDGKWTKCGWLLGFGIAAQPLVALMIPVIIGAAPTGRRLLLTVRSLALSAALVGIALLGNAADTYRALVDQPTPPSLNHATPWVWLAHVVPGPGAQAHQPATMGSRLVPSLNHVTRADVMVAGGPGRLIDVVLAIILGLYVWRRPQDAVRLLWLAAAVLASRCLFEAVMTPYYLAPPLFLALVLAARQSVTRFWLAAVVALEITVFAYHHLNPWVWWLPIVAGLTMILALGYPDDVAAAAECRPPGGFERPAVGSEGPRTESAGLLEPAV
jgi:hypothetical protein